MIRAGWITALACAAIPGWVAAGPFDDPADAGALMGEACVTPSLDFDALFASAQELATAAGLPQVMASDEAAMFGNPGGAHVVFSRRIDSMACQLTIPPDPGTEAFFNDLRDIMQARIDVTYPGALSDEMDTPSPHESAHQWVFRVPKERHFAVSHSWIRDRGVSLSIGYSQIYE